MQLLNFYVYHIKVPFSIDLSSHDKVMGTFLAVKKYFLSLVLTYIQVVFKLHMDLWFVMFTVITYSAEKQ